MTFVWTKWRSYRRILIAKGSAVYGQAVKFSSKKKVFKAWMVSFERSRRHYSSKIARFRIARRTHIIRGCINLWKRFVKEQELERDIDSRVDCAWAEVQGWLK